MFRQPHHLTRSASSIAAGLMVTALTACGSDAPTAPEKDPIIQQPVVETSASIVGTVSLAPGIPGSLANARVAIYTSVADRQFDRLVKQTALSGTGPDFTFTITDVAPGTYYMDVCYLPVSAATCFEPYPDSPITVLANRTNTVVVRVGP